jgi:WD40 repeat protein
MELKLTGHKGIVRSVAFTQDDTRLLSASADYTIKLWDVQEGAEMRTLEGHSNAVYCIQVSGDGNNCVSVGMDKSLRLWDLRAPKCMLSIQMNDYAEMNYVSLSENTKNFNTMKSSKKSNNLVRMRLDSLIRRAFRLSMLESPTMMVL